MDLLQAGADCSWWDVLDAGPIEITSHAQLLSTCSHPCSDPEGRATCWASTPSKHPYGGTPVSSGVLTRGSTEALPRGQITGVPGQFGYPLVISSGWNSCLRGLPSRTAPTFSGGVLVKAFPFPQTFVSNAEYAPVHGGMAPLAVDISLIRVYVCVLCCSISGASLLPAVVSAGRGDTERKAPAIPRECTLGSKVC
ncbi:hypothetical protein VUR80DRAFT_3271 [Thermomyces stellatus]